MGSLFSKLFSKKSAEASAKAPTPPATAPAQPPPGTPPANFPHLNRQAGPGPGTPRLQVPTSATPAAGGIKIPKKRITQRITVSPGGGAASAVPAPGLAPATPMGGGMPTLKIAIPGARKAGSAIGSAAVATTSIAPPTESNLQIPLHTLVKALPQETLRVDQSAFLQTAEAQEMATLPLANILAMLPSGKIEWNARELVAYLPSHLVLTPDEVPEGLNVSLPLASVVGRIPPEFLALRPDQRSVDPAVTNMADPFSQEVLAKLAAEAAAKHEADAAAKTASEFTAPAALAQPVPPPPPMQAAMRPVTKSLGSIARVTQVSPILPPAPLPSFEATPEPLAPPASPAPEPSSFKFDLPPPPVTKAEPLAAIEPEPEPVPEPVAEVENFAVPADETPVEPAAPEPDLAALAQSDSFRALLEKANAEAEEAAIAPEPEPTPEPVAEIVEPEPIVPEVPEPVSQETAPETAIEPEPSPIESVVETPEPAPEEVVPEVSAIESEPEIVEPTPEPVVEPVTEVVEEKPATDFVDSFKVAANEDAGEKEAVVESIPEPEIPAAEATIEPPFEEPAPVVTPEPEIVSEPVAEIVEPEPEPEPVAPEPEPEPEPEAVIESEPEPVIKEEPKIEPEPVAKPVLTPIHPTSVVRPSMVPIAPFKQRTSEIPKVSGTHSDSGNKEIRISLNHGTVDDFVKIAGVTPRLARKILAWRELHGDFTELSQLLGIPGLTQEIYRQFTGDPDSDTAISAKVNLSLGLPLDRKLTIKDIAAHIRRWPSISGCIIAGSEGLMIAKDMVDPELSQSLAAFLPKIMQNLNDTLAQIKALPADEVHIGTEEVGFFIYRKKGIFMVMLSTEKDLPEYYGKVVRSILHELTEGKITRVDL